MHLRPLYPPGKRRALKLILVLILLLLLAGVATIPFLWESSSLWYKFGGDKRLLQTGKIAGLFAAVLVFLQILLASRLILFDRTFGLDKVYFFHQLNGFALACLALLHPFLVLIPEGIDNLPIGWKFWPEMVGATTLLLLIIVIFTASLKKIFIPYHLWRIVHRPMGYLLLIGMGVHILTVSDSFGQDVPRYSFFLVAGVVLLCVITHAFRTIRDALRYFHISDISQISDKVISLEIKVPPSFSFAPGQFAFLRLIGHTVSTEPHPFTIASSPDKNDTLQFMIKKCGDWTSKIDSGAVCKAAIEGPYGLFSYKARPVASHLILIAAGIGITPMISMLRQLSTEEKQPRLMLLWSLRRENEFFLHDELRNLQKELSSFEVHLLFSREQKGERISCKLLGNLLPSFPRTSHFYICGPEQMMVETGKNLQKLGFMGKNIFRERFSL